MPAQQNTDCVPAKAPRDSHVKPEGRYFEGSRERDAALINCEFPHFFTNDQSSQKTWNPVRSPLIKLRSARLVLRSVTTGESLVLFVFAFLLKLSFLSAPFSNSFEISLIDSVKFSAQDHVDICSLEVLPRCSEMWSGKVGPK